MMNAKVKKSRITHLNEETINKIAAGEVVESPASALKELFENAVDAQAKNIRIEAKAGGYQYLAVHDDGKGIDPEDLKLAISRHATSKIHSIEDMHELSSMGFRGEALASIAAISEFKLSTAQKDATQAYYIECLGGKESPVLPVARAQGTSVQVQRLFFNVPARKKFQKSISASAAELYKVVTAMAMTYPDIGVHYTYNDVVQLNIEAVDATDPEQLKFRLSQLFGSDLLENSKYIDQQFRTCRIRGFLVSPKADRPNRRGQYIVINQRFVSSALFTKAICQGYGTSLQTGRFPQFFLYFQVPFDQIDVNVHPQKSSVRIAESGKLFSWIQHAVSMGLNGASWMPNHESFPWESQELKEGESVTSVPSMQFFQHDQSFMTQDLPNAHLLVTKSAEVKQEAKQEILFQEIPDPLMVWKSWAIWDFASVPKLSQILEEVRDEMFEGLLWMDLKRSKARFYYEKLNKKSWSTERQNLLIPIAMKLSPTQIQELLPYFEVLEKIGISISQIGRDEIAIHSILEGFDENSSKNFIEQIIHNPLKNYDLGYVELQEKIKEHCCLALAKSLEISQYKVDARESRQLLFEVVSNMWPVYSPLGKPIFSLWSLKECVQRFKSKR